MDGVDGVVVAPGKVRGYQPQGRMEKNAAAADPATVDTAWRAVSLSITTNQTGSTGAIFG